jgi:hypothetical protein
MANLHRILATSAGAGMLVCAGLITAIAPGVAEGGAWVQPRDSYYFKLSAGYLDSDREFDFDGEEVDIFAGDETLSNATYRDLTVSAYLEYGLTDRLTLIGTLPFRVLTSERTETVAGAGIRRDIDATNGGFGDLTIGARYPLLTSQAPVALQGAVKLPLGYDENPDNGGPPLGSASVDVEGWLLAGLSLYPFPGYLTAGAGYRVKGGDVDDELLFSVEGGVTWRRVMARLGIEGLYSTAEPPDLSEGVSSTVVVTDQDILKLTPALGLLLTEEISLVLEAFQIIDGKNTVSGSTWAAGVVFTQ